MTELVMSRKSEYERLSGKLGTKRDMLLGL